jgi:protein-S-isoprenylcysteine O-methyltransferase Ste14
MQEVVMAVKLVAQIFALNGAMGLVLFLAAGTLNWAGAWIWLSEVIVIFLVGGLWLARHDPALLIERLAPPIQKDQPTTDKILLNLFILGVFGALALMGLDAVRFRWSSVPIWVQVIGNVILLLSVWIHLQTMRANTFAVNVVKIQGGRGHTVIATGPYRRVRHPMYAATIGFLFGTSLLLGSWWGVAAVLLLFVLLGIRVRIEERTLRVGLAGYDDYAANVRYRLIPLVW